MTTIDPNDFRYARRGNGQVVIVSAREASTDGVCNAILEGIARHLFHPRADRELLMESVDAIDYLAEDCVSFYVNVTVRRSKVYKRKSRTIVCNPNAKAKVAL